MGYPPFSWVDDLGQPEGILVDAMEQILHEKLGIPVQLKVYPWKRAQQMVEFGEADAFITVPTVERSRYTEIVEPPILPTEFKIFVSANNPKRSLIERAGDLEDLKKIQHLSTGYLTGSGWHIEHLSDFPAVMTAAKLSEILKMVDAQRLDIYVDSAVVVDYHLKEYGLTGKVIAVGHIMDAPTWNLCIGKNSKYAAYTDAIAVEIKKLAESGELMKITKPITAKYNDTNSNKDPKVSKFEEQQL